ncbi:phospholipase D-like domain-containing protein [Flavobacteriales bacterium]|nr:phospholipase D-like domain-containing protein [Flavobacteriales bacterium]MDB4088907.1 phospholipase D-like domain-containing protein [Flavobacteriales bacterium]
MITKLFHKGLEKKVLTNLANSKTEVKIAVELFTNPVFFKTLIKLNENGVKIELVLSDDSMNFTNPKVNFQKLIDLGIKIKVTKSPNLMHNNFCVIDERLVVTGSYSWTLKAEYYNFENIIVSNDKELINDYLDCFQDITDKTTEITDISKATFSKNSSKKEIDFEFGLEGAPVKIDVIAEVNPKKKAKKHSKAILEQIKKAELLYLTGKHKDCIEFCGIMLIENQEVEEIHILLAKSYWRTNNIKSLISTAKKAQELNSELYEAYNLLGIGYSKDGKEQLSSKNFNICIKKHSEEHIYVRNRAIAFIDLESDPDIPVKFRNKYKVKADADLGKIIEIINKTKEEELDCYQLYSRAFGYSQLGKLSLARKDIKQAIEMYGEIADKFKKDKNEFTEMKKLLSQLKKAKE